MKTVSVTARLLAPLAIRRDRQSERSESARSVAGTLVRGAFASIYLQRHGQTDDTFERLFLNDAACRFGPLDPGPQVFPLTAASCKRESRHTLVDLLWFRVAQHYLAGRRCEGAAAWQQCVQCEADLKARDGFWQDERGHVRSTSSTPHVAAHVGIDRRTGTAADSIFYTLEALAPAGDNSDFHRETAPDFCVRCGVALAPSGDDTDLHGWLRADDDAIATLEQLLQDEGGRISIGHARTRGYGDVHLTLGEWAAPEDPRSQVERWRRWSSDLNDFLQKLSIPDSTKEDFFFAISLPTGAVIVDRFLRYSLDPADMVDWLPRMPAVSTAFPLRDRAPQHLESGGAVRWIAAVTRHELLRGWNAAHGLPRQDEWTVARGAVYVYRFEGAASQREALVRQLAALAEDGIGLRRNEGFGVVSVSNEFHSRFLRQEAQPCTF